MVELFKGITVGYSKENTLDKAFSEVAWRLSKRFQIVISPKDIKDCSEGLSPQNGGLERCLTDFAMRLIKKNIHIQPNGNYTVSGVRDEALEKDNKTVGMDDGQEAKRDNEEGS